MQISQELPQFNVRNSLILISAKHGLEIYKAHQGHIEKLKEFRIENPRYSDREGFFMSRSKNVGTIRTGSVGEISDEDIKRDFFQKWKGLIKENDFKEITKEVDDVYLFSPGNLITEFKDEMPSEVANKIAMEFQKNYLGAHPFKILEKIDQKLTEKISEIKDVPRTEEEKKILEIKQQ
ncbi:MAG: hypothetical protein R6V40_02470 [Candidatus Moraniibacteriota bacterium]